MTDSVTEIDLFVGNWWLMKGFFGNFREFRKRWLTARVLSRERATVATVKVTDHGFSFNTHAHQDGILGARVLTCAECGAEYAIPAGRDQRVQRCRRCDRKHLSQKQRQRRQSSRQRSQSCARCGEAFTPQRATARYCSTRCRVAAHRAKQ
jgi:hypothetical protein